MFILRHVQENGQADVNHILGSHYKVVKYLGNKAQFNQVAELYYSKGVTAEQLNKDGCYAFVVSEKITIPLKYGWNYIMTDSGKTFENISEVLPDNPDNKN